MLDLGLALNEQVIGLDNHGLGPQALTAVSLTPSPRTISRVQTSTGQFSMYPQYGTVCHPPCIFTDDYRHIGTSYINNRIIYISVPLTLVLTCTYDYNCHSGRLVEYSRKSITMNTAYIYRSVKLMWYII